MVEAYASYIGGKAQLVVDKGFTIPIIIKDVRSSFGRLDAKVWPVGGTGEQWVNFTRLDMVKLPEGYPNGNEP